MESTERKARTLLAEHCTARERLVTEIRKLRRRQLDLDIEIQLLKRLLSSANNDDQESDREAAEEEMRDTHVASNNQSTVDFLEGMLRSAGGPMRVINMVRQAVNDGYGGADATQERLFSLFSSALDRGVKAGRFVKVGRGVFGLSPASALESPKPVPLGSHLIHTTDIHVVGVPANATEANGRTPRRMTAEDVRATIDTDRTPGEVD